MKNCQFIIKLLDILQKYPDAVYWEPDGQSLTFRDIQVLSNDILPIYFKHSNCLSFFRQMNMYGFTRAKHLKDSYTYEHEIFKIGNEKNFHQIGRRAKTRAFKNAQQDFEKRRKDIIQKFGKQADQLKISSNLLLDSLFFKDQIHQNMREIKGWIKKLSNQLSDSRSQKVIQRLVSIKEKDLHSLVKSENTAKEIDKLIEEYNFGSHKKGKIDQQMEECSIQFEGNDLKREEKNNMGQHYPNIFKSHYDLPVGKQFQS